MALIIHYVTYSCCLPSSTNIGQIGSDSPSQSEWVPNLSVPLGVFPLVYERNCSMSGLAKRADGIYRPDTPCRREDRNLRACGQPKMCRAPETGKQYRQVRVLRAIRCMYVMHSR